MVGLSVTRDPSDSYCLPLPLPSGQNNDGEKSAEQTVSVSLLSAGHCPGSVMFLFDGCRGRVLYTGDFRLSLSDLKLMRPLHSRSGVVKKVDCLYFDSTFCVKQALNIPTRKESLEAMIKLISNWMSPHDDCGKRGGFKRKVLIYCAARYGHEYLLKGLYEHFEWKVHVTGVKWRVYSSVEPLSHFATVDPSETPLHACQFWSSDEFEQSVAEGELPLNETLSSSMAEVFDGPCSTTKAAPSKKVCPALSMDDSSVLIIKPSMMWFQQMNSYKGIVYHDRKQPAANFYRVKFSFHSSLSEVRDMVEYLSPNRISPNVVPTNSSLESVMKLLNYSSPHATSFDVEIDEKTRDCLKSHEKISSTEFRGPMADRMDFLRRMRRKRRREEREKAASLNSNSEK